MHSLVSDFLAQRPASAVTYEQALREAAFVMVKPIQDFSHEDVVSYRTLLLEQQAPSTVKKKMAALGSFFKYLKERGIRDDNPTNGMVRTKADWRPQRAHFIPTEDQVEIVTHVDSPRDRGILWVLLHGLRISEAVSLNVDHLQGTELVAVVGKGGRVRDIPLEPTAIEALRAQLGGRSSGPMFLNVTGSRLSVRGMRKIVYGYTSRLLGQRMNPHALRHAFASRLAREDVSPFIIRDLLGHASVATTNVYVRMVSDDLRRTINEKALVPAESGLRVIQGGLKEAI